MSPFYDLLAFAKEQQRQFKSKQGKKTKEELFQYFALSLAEIGIGVDTHDDKGNLIEPTKKDQQK